MKPEDFLFKKFGRIVPAGTLLFQEGEACTGMFIIQKGKVRLFLRAGDEEVTLDTLGEGDFFGETACLLEQPRLLSARTEEESHLLLIEPEVLEELFRSQAGTGMKIVMHLASRLKKAYEMIARLSPPGEKASE
jgi:membrane protein